MIAVFLGFVLYQHLHYHCHVLLELLFKIFVRVKNHSLKISEKRDNSECCLHLSFILC
jgi:hypothetical protein